MSHGPDDVEAANLCLTSCFFSLAGGKLEKHRDNDEWVLVVETCHQCECHRQEWLRHDPQDYRPVQSSCVQRRDVTTSKCLPWVVRDILRIIEVP